MLTLHSFPVVSRVANVYPLTRPVGCLVCGRQLNCGKRQNCTTFHEGTGIGNSNFITVDYHIRLR